MRLSKETLKAFYKARCGEDISDDKLEKIADDYSSFIVKFANIFFNKPISSLLKYVCEKFIACVWGIITSLAMAVLTILYIPINFLGGFKHIWQDIKTLRLCLKHRDELERIIKEKKEKKETK